MKLDLVQITGFRNLRELSLNPSPTLNLIYGLNGSGKSSLLEAIHYIGFGRSFRTSKHKNVIKHDAEKFVLFARGVGEGEVQSSKFGLSRTVHDELVVNINGERTTKASELALCVPVQIFSPQSTDLILGSPKVRRKYMDWSLFHVEHGFNQLSQSFNKVLKQRNALLRTQATKIRTEQHQIEYWDNIMVDLANKLDLMRKTLIEALKERINANLTSFLPEISAEISYYRGWNKDANLSEVLKHNIDKDIKNGFTSVGPHKADLRLKVNGVSIAEVLSRGQLRMFVAAMQIAQTQHLDFKRKKKSVFLLDDIGAELDSTKRQLFIEELLACNAQLFITAIEKEQFTPLDNYQDKKMFHVEHGSVKEE